MASYSAKIDVIIGGIRELAALEGRLEQIQNIASALKRDPIDLNIGGRGKSRDLSGKLSKEINDVIRDFTNGERKLGKSVSSINKQTSLFRDVLDQTALKGNALTASFQRQDPVVRQLITVYNDATKEAKDLELQQRNVIRSSKGLQSEFQREIQLINRRTRVDRLRARKAKGREALSSGLIGGAFPLLFGQGLGASAFGGLGGVAGGALGGQLGFGLSLVGTVIGTTIDNLNVKLRELAVSLKDPIAGLEALEELGFKVSDSTKKQIDALIDAGKVYDAQTLLFEEIANRLGTDSVNQLNALGEATDALDEEFAKAQATLISELIPTLTVFTQLLAGVVGVINKLQIPKSLLEAGVGAVVSTLLPGVGALGTGLAGKGFLSLNQRLAPGTEPDRNQERLDQFNAERIQKNKVALLQNEIDLIKIGNNLLDDAVFKEREKAILGQFSLKRLNAALAGELDAVKAAELKLQREKALSALIKDRDRQQAQLDRKNNKKTGEDRALERQLKLRKRLSIKLERANALLKETDKFQRDLLKIRFARQDIEAQIAQVTDPMKRSELQALADENTKMEEQNVLRQIMLDQVNSLEIAFDRERTQLENYMDQLRKQLTDTEAVIINLSQAIETSFASAMSSAVQDAVNGTRTVGQVFAQMFADIGNAFIDLATRLLAQQAVLSILGLFNFGGGGGTSFSQGVNSGLPQFGNYSGINNFGGFGGLRANGGSVSSGKSYIVGERGPELFVPRSSGTIVPNDKMGGGGVQVGSINIKVENTGDQLSPQAQKQLANQVQGIVLSTLTNERRSGGML